jgi:hypothetical protein
MMVLGLGNIDAAGGVRHDEKGRNLRPLGRTYSWPDSHQPELKLKYKLRIRI